MKRGLLYAATIALLAVPSASVHSASNSGDGTTERRHVGAGSIAAGRAHTVIARPDGSVHAWGAGQHGQLGVGGQGDRLSPMEVSGLVGIVSVSAGAAHTVALSSSGEVFAWGANTFGRLGDGTRMRRERPVRIAGLSAVKAIAAGRAHTLALTADGRVFAWGGNSRGQVGNGKKAAVLSPLHVKGVSDVIAIAAGGAHSLAATRDGRLYAWGSNEFGAIGDGTTRDRGTPVLIDLRDVVSVAAGGAHSLALLRSGAVYSWGRGTNGELGTGVTKIATRPTAVEGLSATVIAAGLHFSGAISSGGEVLTWGANQAGQLGDGTKRRRLRPVRVAGLQAAASLALGSLHGAAVTLDGDVLTWGEGDLGRLGTGALSDYTAPQEIISNLPDWGSEPGEDPEPVDVVPPSIRAVVSPPPTEGWMTTAVTVSFECEDAVAIASCSQPTVVNQDGVTAVIGRAADSAGNTSTIEVTIRIDLQPPVATIAEFPASTNAEDIVVSGSVTDMASGVTAVTCNGAPVAVDDGTYHCTLHLRPGRNALVVQARDAVGHETSSSVIVSRVGAPTALFLTPAVRTVGLDDVSRLTLLDEFGVRVGGALWHVDDDRVVALSDEEPPTITAIGPGTATVVAEKDGLHAEAVVRVVPSLVAGDERWSLPSTPLLSPEPPLFANRVSSESPLIFAVDYEDWDRKLVRAVSSEGEVLWQQHVPGVPLMADAFGGFVAGVLDEVGDMRALMRTGGGTTTSWRYDSRGILDRPAQAYDGTIYTIESIPNGKIVEGHEMQDKFAVVIDGLTGRLVAKSRLEPDLNQYDSKYDGQTISSVPPVLCRSYRYEYAPEVVGPIAGADGRGYLAVRRHAIVKNDLCNEPVARRPERTIAMGIDLIVLSRTEAPKTIPIYSTSCHGTLGSVLPCDHPVRAIQLMPDGIGGTIVTWERGIEMVGQSVLVQKAMTVIDVNIRIERDVPFNFSIEMVGQSGMTLTYGDGWKAIDARTGDPVWSALLPDLTPLAARPGGGVAAFDWNTSELAMVSAAGEIETRQPFGLDWRSVNTGGDWIGLKGASVTAVAGTFDDATRYAVFDTRTGQQRVRLPGVGIWLKTHQVGSPNVFQHVSIRVTPFDQEWLLRNRSRFETCASNACVPLGKDTFGNHFFTIGAGAGSDDTSPVCGGILTKGFNRPNDVNKPPGQPLLELPIDWRLQPTMMNSLMQRFDGFKNYLPYFCFPEDRPGHYNSNSFGHGLLHAASIGHEEAPPTRKRLPGWLTPVPIEVFFENRD